jgi:YVTN family beta-propeller protein
VIDTADQTVVAVIPVAGGPVGVAVHPDSRRVYVAAQGDDSIAVIDAGNNRVTASVALPLVPPPASLTRPDARSIAQNTPTSGNTPTVTLGPTLTPTPKRVGAQPVGIAVAPDGMRVYVTSVGGLTALDATSLAALANLPVPVAKNDSSRLQGVAVSPDGARVYAAVDNGYGSPGALVIVDASVLTILATIPVGVRPLGVAVHPDGARVYVANTLSDTLSVVDPVAARVSATLPIAGGPQAVAVDPGGDRVYVTSFGGEGGENSRLSVVDAASNEVIETFAAGPAAFGLAIDPAGARVVVVNAANDTLSILDAASGAVLGTASTGVGPSGFGQFLGPPPDPHATPTLTPTPGPRRELAYVTNRRSKSVSIIDTATNRVIGSIDAELTPWELAASSDGRTVSVATYDGINGYFLETYSAATHELLATVPLAHGAYSLTAAPSRSELYVDGYGAVSVVDTLTHAIAADIEVPLGEGASAITPDGQSLLVTRSLSLSIIDTARRAVVETIEFPYAPGAIAIAPDGGRAYVDNASTYGEITVIDLARRRSTGTIPLPFGVDWVSPGPLAVAPDGLTLFAITYHRFPYPPRSWRTLSVIDTDTNMVTATLTPEVDAEYLAFSRETGRGYVVNGGANTVSVIDAVSRTLVDTIPVGSRPWRVVVAQAPDATLLPTVTVRPTRTPTTTPTSTLENCQRSLALRPNHGPPASTVWVSGQCDLLAHHFYGTMRWGDSGDYLSAVWGDEAGVYQTQFAVPARTRPGASTVHLVTSGDVASAVFTVDPPCTGDCDGRAAVHIEELIVGVQLALGVLPIDRCPAFDAHPDGAVTIDELTAAVQNALNNCGRPAS